MDEERFDNLARAIAGTTTRRAVLGRLAGAVGGGMLATIGLRSTEAALCRGLNRPCRKSSDCCNGNCVYDEHGPNGPHGHCRAAASTTSTTTSTTSTSTTTATTSTSTTAGPT